MVSMNYVLRTPKQIVCPNVHPEVNDPRINSEDIGMVYEAD